MLHTCSENVGLWGKTMALVQAEQEGDCGVRNSGERGDGKKPQ